ncbi:MAG: hypothetical protein ABEJ36_04030 [Candidatus Nanosalina sp.]
MSLKGWGIALLLSPPTMGLSLIIYFYIWFFTKVGKFYIKGMLMTIKVPLAIISYILSEIMGAGHFVTRTIRYFYEGGIANIKKAKKQTESDGSSGFFSSIFSEVESVVGGYKLRYVALFIGIMMFLDYPTTVATVMSRISVSSVTSNPLGFLLDQIGMVFVLFIPFGLTLFFSWISYQVFGDGDMFWKVKDVGSQIHGGLQSAAAGGGAAAAAGAAKGAAEKGVAGAAKGVQAADTAAKGAKTAKNAAEAYEDLEVAEAAGEVAGEGGMAAEVLGESAIAGASTAAASAGVVLAALIVTWIFYVIVAGAISLVLIALTWGYIAQLLPLVAGFVMPILGLGNAYAQWFGQSTANVVAPQLGGAFQEEMLMIQQMGAKIGCALKGPQCLRQWRMNNTVRPGSESRGETYQLKIKQFGMTQQKLDVAYKEKNYTLPISFLIYNTRHGLKGITARNVRYRVLVEDASHQGANAYCKTDWEKVTTGTGDFILPGLGVSLTKQLSELNLANCGMLQPSMGINRVLQMQVKYDYSSQATLYFKAMSRKYRRENAIMPDFKKSKTAKTPVQSYINIRSPVTYFKAENGSRQAVPFPARFGFETPGFTIKYHVKPESIAIDDSSMTTHIPKSCSGLSSSAGGESDYGISNSAKDRIDRRQTPTRWFKSGINPAPLRCTFKLEDEDLSSINPTGEQLIMRIDANYTVVREKEHASFSLVNTRCSRMNCPMLVTESYNRTHSGLMYSKCTFSTSVDVRGGCIVLDPKGDNSWDPWGPGNNRIYWAQPEPYMDGAKPLQIQQGETAYQWSNIVGTSDPDRQIDSKYIINDTGIDVVGLRPKLKKKMAYENVGAVLRSSDGRFYWRNIRKKWCTENDQGMKEFGKAYDSQTRDRVVYFKAERHNCHSGSGGILDDIADAFGSPGDDTVNDVENHCESNDAGSPGEPEGDPTSLVINNYGNLKCYHNKNDPGD